MRAAFTTLGCRVNQYESEAMTEKFISAGFDIVSFNSCADVYVINTCTVTNMGDKKSRQMINRAKKMNSDAIIAVVGCYSQVAPEEVARIEGVDIVLGTKNKGEIVQWVYNVLNEKKQVVEVNDVLKDKMFEDLKIEEYQDKTRAFMKVQDGCNRFCSYCLIPYARGAVCSKDKEKVLDEIRELGRHGFKEIILSGIHTASYGADFENGYGLMELLEDVEKIEDIKRVRIGSIDPAFFTEGVISRITSLKKLCPHFHLSLQSGCDETLKRMNRHYTTAQYKDIVSALRLNIPDVSITTDIIVGFPGETEEEFDITYNFLKDLELSKMHIFKFSPRTGTAAAKMKDDVLPSVKDSRSRRLIELNKLNEVNFMKRFTGRKMPVLFEKRVTNQENIYEGYSPNYIAVSAESSEDLTGKIINCELVSAGNGSMTGIVC